MDVLLFFFLGMNLLGFILMGVDKRKARRSRWRIQEKDLLAVAAIFGALGVWAGMKAFRHKTKHKKFTIVLPILVVVHICLLYLYLTLILPGT